MKKETMQEKINKLLGLTEVAEEVKQQTNERKGNLVGISEEEIQSYRRIQGLHYFFQAPELFEEKVCKHCRHVFLVSRKYVAYCSYDCIEASMRENWGIEWSKAGDYEAAVKSPDIFDGNEPLWIRDPQKLYDCLQVLEKILKNDSGTESLQSETLNLGQETNSSTAMSSIEPVATTVNSSFSQSRPTTTSFGKIPIPKF